MDELIKELHPAIRQKAVDFKAKVEKELGITLKIYFGKRSFEEQQEIYDRPRDGKDNDGDGKIDEADEKVTNAKAGQSYHNYGLAIDVVPIVKGKAIWNINHPIWKKVAFIGKSVGFEWGGDFKNFVDAPHFQYPKGVDWQFLAALKKARKLDKEGYVLLP